MRFKKLVFFVFVVQFAFLGCTTLKKIDFKTPVDTRTKKISLQKKKVYSFNNEEVFVSNKFDGARLNGFQKINDSTFKAIIRPENTPINNSAYYSFKIWSKESKPIFVELDYPKGFKHRYVPKIKSSSFGWTALNSDNIVKNNGIVTVKINVSKDTTWVSAQEIVTSKDTERWVSKAIKNKAFVNLKSVGKSKLGRNLPVLDIYKGSKEQKPIVVLLTRQHPPEVTGFFAYQEFLKTILKENELTNEFLNKFRIITFPIINPDGVDLGHWRHNAGGVDTNRDWSKYRQPEIKQVAKYIVSQSKKSNGKIVLGLDFHSTYEDVFYTNKIRKSTSLPNFIEEWFKALETNIPNFKVNEKAGNSKKPVSKGWFLYGHNALGITYEIGDATPRDKIKVVGKITAEEMMKILIKTNIN